MDKPLKRYRVTWEIEVSAETPEQAAIEAQELQQRPTQADHFEVACIAPDGEPEVFTDGVNISEVVDRFYQPQERYPAVVIMGNPVDGLEFIGPFWTTVEANEYADFNSDDREWWVAKLQRPDDPGREEDVDARQQPE